MLIISDTNILSSLAAGDALPLLFRLFPNKTIYIPPAVHQELLVGLARRSYLAMVLEAADLLRLFWLNHIASYHQVEQLITRMEQVENFVLSESDRAKVFAPRPSQHRRR